ncbi:hypothetical protein F1643_21010 [Azospirillum sp. INR13]|uniref:hypothetical protein n=1 Tax=Azospirillum sp. INR13 TaxID=2596919 RepID=UPI001891F3F3|nr:hypothetical protein [Azospirillum sp. INR13]MBF5096480.1 hypothetical protein [Azospirillum sp. INR13]
MNMSKRTMSDAELAEAIAFLTKPRTYADRLCEEIVESTSRFEEAESITRTTVEYFLLPARMAVTPVTAFFRR